MVRVDIITKIEYNIILYSWYYFGTWEVYIITFLYVKNRFNFNMYIVYPLTKVC